MRNVTVTGTDSFLVRRLSAALADMSAETETLVFCGAETELGTVAADFPGRIVFLADAARSLDRKRLLGENYDEYETRFMLSEAQPLPGVSSKGISERFQERNVPDNVILDRCCEIGGTGTSLAWLSAHLHGTNTLRYVSFGGSGKQVFDLLHAADLAALVAEQIRSFRPGLYHVSGGPRASVSLLELTAVCECATGHVLRITDDESRREIPVFSLDTGRLEKYFTWRPERGVEEIIRDMLKEGVPDLFCRKGPQENV